MRSYAHRTAYIKSGSAERWIVYKPSALLSVGDTIIYGRKPWEVLIVCEPKKRKHKLTPKSQVEVLTNDERIKNREEAIARFSQWPKWKREAFTYRKTR